MRTKLTVLINWGYTVQVVTWLPHTEKYLGYGKSQKLPKPVHYAVQGTHIFMSESLYQRVSTESPDDREEASYEILLQDPDLPG